MRVNTVGPRELRISPVSQAIMATVTGDNSPQDFYNIYKCFAGGGGWNQQRLLAKLIQNTNSNLGLHEIHHFYKLPRLL